MVLLETLAIAMLLQVLFFIPAFLFRTDKLTDFTYGLTFIMLAAYLFIYNSLPLLLLAMIAVWAVRLVAYLVIRIHKMGRDNRFDEMRSNLAKFAGFWFFQGLTVWVVMLPAIYTDSMPQGSLAVIGLCVWALGLLTETVADYQKYRHKLHSRKWIETGLWRYSRHPNYFGEILCWIGVYLYAFPALTGTEAFIAVTGPFYIAFILLFVSGIPMLEKSADKKYGKDRAYQKYKKSTSILIPLPKLG